MNKLFKSPNDHYNYIEVVDNKIIDLATGDHYAGCRCNATTYRKIGECDSYENCLNRVMALLSLEDCDYLIKFLKKKTKCEICGGNLCKGCGLCEDIKCNCITKCPTMIQNVMYEFGGNRPTKSKCE